MKKILLVIDMQEGFCKKGNPLYVGDQCGNIMPFILRKIEEYNDAGHWVFFTGDSHEPDDLEFRMFPAHCVRDTEEENVLTDLWNAAKYKKIFHKTRYSAFYGTKLEDEIKAVQPDLIEMVGVCTNICVFFTCEELRNRDYWVTVLKDGVTSFDIQAHQQALQQMSSVLGAAVE